MFAGPMRKDYALSLIDRFPPLPKGRPFPRIDPAELIADLRKRVKDPVSQDQDAAGLDEGRGGRGLRQGGRGDDGGDERAEDERLHLGIPRTGLSATVSRPEVRS